MRAPIGGQAIERATLEPHTAGFIVQGAADAVDERALARAVGSDQAQAFASCHVEVDVLQGDETAEAFADGLDFEQRCAHRRCLAWRQSSIKPIMPFGAITTKPTSSTPTISRLTAEEMVTVAICCNEPSRIAPISGPSQLVVPPIIGMAIELTA